jgi:hypothetical protein
VDGFKVEFVPEIGWTCECPDYRRTPDWLCEHIVRIAAHEPLDAAEEPKNDR